MTPLLLPLFVVCAVAAWTLTRGWLTQSRWPFYQSVATLLSWVTVADATRWTLDRWLAGKPVPYVGLYRALFHAEQVLWLSWPFGLAALGSVVFLRRTPWSAAAAWAAWSACVAAAYPELRLHSLWVAYAVATWACCLFVVGVTLVAYLRAEVFLAHHVATLLLTIGTGATAHVLLEADVVGVWYKSRMGYAMTLGILLFYQVRQIVRYRR